MTKGPKGQKRPTDVASNAVHVMRIATGQIGKDAPVQAALRAKLKAKKKQAPKKPR